MTETTKDILVHTEAGVTTITFNRVDKKLHHHHDVCRHG